MTWEVVPAALHNGIGLLPWSPLAGGFLTGKYRRGLPPEQGTRAGSNNPLYQWVSEEYASVDRNWATIDTVTRIAAELGATAPQVALRWLMDRPGVTAPIVGARSVEQLTDSITAVDLQLPEDQRTALDEVSRPTSGGYPYGAFGRTNATERSSAPTP